MYYSGFGILALTMCIVINYGILRTDRKKEQSVVVSYYRRFLLSVILYLFTDILWGITYEKHYILPVYLDTVFYFLSMALSVVLWTGYVVEYLKNNTVFDTILKRAGQVMFLVIFICLTVNFFSPVLFSFDTDGTYRPLQVRYFFLGTQILLFAATAVYTFFVSAKSHGKARHHNLTVALSGLVMTVFIILQTLYPLLPFYAIGCLLASTLIHSFVAVEKEQDRNHMLENALEEAERANAAKTVFLSNMSHEIRTPINAILGMNEIIRRECKDEKILASADNIQKAGTSLLGIISDILDFSKIEAGKMELFNEEYYVPDMIGDIYNLIRFRAEEKGLEFLFEIDPDLPLQLIGDELRIKQVITNLLTNAVKYTEKGSVTLQVKVENVEKEYAGIQFLVIDTGIGIKDEEKDKLFEAFDRLDMKRTRDIEGTGLGLSISSYLLKMMGSKLCVKSRYNVGSTFYFKIIQKVMDATPIGDPWMDAVSPRDQLSGQEGLSFSSPESRILLVDDTPLNLEVICGLLEPTRIQIDTAESGEECVEKFGKDFYDFVFLDYLMPKMDGIETLEKLKELYPEKTELTPIVSLTANAVSGERERMLEAGFTDYLTKPVIISSMMNMLIQYLPEEKIHIRKNEEEQQNSSLDGIPEKLLIIPWLDVREGIAYCGTSDMYMRGLALFANGIDDKADLLEESLSKQDINLFTVTVHALKSSSLTMGLTDFSAKARELELAGKEKDLDKILDLFPDFVALFRSLKPRLLEAITDV